MPTSRHERALRLAGYQAIAGVDEVGRGALFGPVYAAAVILNPQRPVKGLDDSKQLSAERREVLAGRIQERALAWAIGVATSIEIDQINILEASRLAMRRAVLQLPLPADSLLVDAIHINVDLPQRALIHGDALSFSIAAASIVAKVARDQAMRRLDADFPGYGLHSNKGYGSPDHLNGLQRLGPTPLHRYSFSPVRAHARDYVWPGYSSAINNAASPQDLGLPSCL